MVSPCSINDPARVFAVNHSPEQHRESESVPATLTPCSVNSLPLLGGQPNVPVPNLSLSQFAPQTTLDNQASPSLDGIGLDAPTEGFVRCIGPIDCNQPGKGVSRQARWKRKKREEAHRAKLLETLDPGATSTRQKLEAEEMESGVAQWPRLKSPVLRKKILDAGVLDMEKLLKSKVRCPQGQNFTRHQQVLQFMHIQRKKPGSTRVELALQIAEGFGKGRHVSERILQNENEWVKKRSISEGQQGKHAKVSTMLEDEGTVTAVREYLAGAGEKVTAPGLANAVAQYWRAQNASEEEISWAQESLTSSSSPHAHEEGTHATTTANQKQSVTSRTAATWLHRMGFAWKGSQEGWSLEIGRT